MPASTRSKDPQPPQTHILDFSYDKTDSCSFTARINDEIFHIVVDPTKLKGDRGEDSDVLTEYQLRLSAVRETDEAEEAVSNFEQYDADGTQSENPDSGVDVSSDDSRAEKTQQKPRQRTGSVRDSSNSVLDLQNWILECFGSEIAQEPPADIGQTRPSKQSGILEQWYNPSTYFYEVESSDSGTQLQPVQLEETSTLRKRVDNLRPRLPLPQKLRSLCSKIPWLHASTLTVLSESEDPPPIHPSLVRGTIDEDDDTEQTYFFKPVDPTQPQPTKREIELLCQIHTKGLDEKFHVPRIRALVGYENSHMEIMGFLLTPIDNPVPLTKLLDSEVDESKRLRWAKETERIVRLLHEQGIVWGDAKADNFMVDGNDEVWVIDFGGSYTEGWVDPELNETMCGDEMGLKKIVNGLRDPDGMTCDPEAGVEGPVGFGAEEEKEQQQEEEEEGVRLQAEVEQGKDCRGKKRSRSGDRVAGEGRASGEDEVEGGRLKRRRS